MDVPLVGFGVFDTGEAIGKRSKEGQQPLHKLGRLDGLFESFRVEEWTLDEFRQRVPVPLGIVLRTEDVCVQQKVSKVSVVNLDTHLDLDLLDLALTLASLVDEPGGGCGSVAEPGEGVDLEDGTRRLETVDATELGGGRKDRRERR